MNAAGILTGREKPFEVREAVAVDANASHVEVGSGRDLDFFAREIETDAQAAITHAGKVFLDEFRSEMRDINPHRAVFRPASRHDFHIAGAGNAVARGTF